MEEGSGILFKITKYIQVHLLTIFQWQGMFKLFSKDKNKYIEELIRIVQGEQAEIFLIGYYLKFTVMEFH